MGIGWHWDTSTYQVAGSTAWLLTLVTHFDTHYGSFAKPNVVHSRNLPVQVQLLLLLLAKFS